MVECVRAATQGQGVDRVVEVDIAANAMLDPELIRSGGDAVVYGSGAAQFTLPFFPLIVRNITLRFFIVYNLNAAHRAAAIATLTSWLGRGQLQHRIAARLPLESIAEAHELVESGRAVVNVVLDIR